MFKNFKNPLRGSSEDAGVPYALTISSLCKFTLQITFLASHIPHLMAANMPDTHTGVYASQTRDDFSADDVEHYFNYMGMLATEVSSRGNDWDI